jgi:predicted RNase H-like HicB family nuclease
LTELKKSREGEMSRYSMIVQWSEDNQLFLVTIPEFGDRVVMPCTYGITREEAILNGEEVIKMYLETWQAEGESIPEVRPLQIA